MAEKTAERADELLARALARLGPRQSEMEALLRELVEINSHSENVAGVAAVADRLAEALERVAGLRVGLRKMRTDGRYAPHLVATTDVSGPRTLLIGHLDTVFRPKTFDGYRSDGQRAFGPGVLDMKGGLVVMTFALRALAEADVLGRIPLALIAVSDEEVGSPDSQALLREVALEQGSRRALVFESGRPEDLIVTQRKGTGGATIVAQGRAAHAGNDHAEGRNAIWALARFIDLAQKLTDYARGVTVNVGRIEGGMGRNTVPAQAQALVDFRFVAAKDGEAMLAALEQAAEQAAREVPGTRFDLEGQVARPALERTAASGALYEAYAACARAAGLGAGEAPLQGGGSDGNIVAALGIPVIDALGPRGTGYHTHDEQIELATLVPKAEAVVRLLVQDLL